MEPRCCSPVRVSRVHLLSAAVARPLCGSTSMAGGPATASLGPAARPGPLGLGSVDAMLRAAVMPLVLADALPPARAPIADTPMAKARGRSSPWTHSRSYSAFVPRAGAAHHRRPPLPSSRPSPAQLPGDLSKMDNSEMNNSPAPTCASFLDLLNTGSGEMNWGDTQDFSPIGEQVTTPIENVVASGKPKPQSRKGVPKGKNWSSLEDKVLIESWANTSLDGVVGADQHSDSYWARITEYYNQHKNPAWQLRNVASVNERYTTISSATSKFCGCLQQVLNRNQSERTLDEKKEEAHLMFIQNDPKKKPFTFMHCYLEFVKYTKWELRELEVSHKKQKKKSDASPGVSAAAIIDDDLSVSSKMLEREEAPSGTKHEKETRKGKNPMSDGSSCKLSLQSVWAQKQEKDEMKEASKSARYAQVIELQKEKIALKKIDVELKQFEIDERVMLVDTSGMNTLQKQFYEGKQKEIIARRQ